VETLKHMMRVRRNTEKTLSSPARINRSILLDRDTHLVKTQ
jgi:hypothetical protein